jgi:hypothetical protein
VLATALQFRLARLGLAGSPRFSADGRRLSAVEAKTDRRSEERSA